MQEILILIGKSTYFYDKGNTKAEKELTMLKEQEENRGVEIQKKDPHREKKRTRGEIIYILFYINCF